MRPNREPLPQLHLEQESWQLFRAALVVRLGETWLGIAPQLLQEVTTDRKATRIARRTAGKLEGVVQVSGTLHLCVSLAELFELGERPPVREQAKLLVLRHQQRSIAVRVDEVHGVVRVEAAKLADAPGLLPQRLAACVESMFVVEHERSDRKVLLLETEAFAKALSDSLYL
jgi:chemotaxis-related protein WspD